MIEREIASAMKFIIAAAGSPNPYYYDVPQDFLVPAVYFPQPEIVARGDTFSTYALSYAWYVMFFHKDSPSAYALGFAVLSALQAGNNLVPIVDENGVLTGRGFRMQSPSLKVVDSGAVRLVLEWDSVRPYSRREYELAAVFGADVYSKGAFDEAVVKNIRGGYGYG